MLWLRMCADERTRMVAPLQVPQLLTFDEAARRLVVCKRTVRRLVERGDLPVVRVGGSVRITAAALTAYITVHTETASEVSPEVHASY